MNRRTAALFALAFAGSAGTATAEETRLDTLRDLSRHLVTKCRDPRLEAVGTVVAIRFSLRADGDLLGPPRIEAIHRGSGDRTDAALLRREVDAAMRSCLPAPISAGLGRAVAGRVWMLRLGRGPSLPKRTPSREI